MKKLTSILLALVMVLCMSATAFAEVPTSGSITINPNTDKSVTTKDKTFNAYKVLDLIVNDKDGDKFAYTVPAELKNFYATTVNTTVDDAELDNKAYAYVAALTGDALLTFAKNVLAAAKLANITPSTGTGDGDDVVLQNLPLGYYVVEDEGTAMPISALMLDTVTGATTDAVLTLKASTHTFDKTVTGAITDAQQEALDAVYAEIGKVLNFTITHAVEDMRGYESYEYVITDVMTKGLTFNNDVVVKVGDDVQTAYVNDETAYNYKVTTADEGEGTKITINFPTFLADYKNVEIGAPITVTYSATVNNAALTLDTESNTATLTYSNNPYETNDKGTKTDIVYVYNFDIEVLKHETNNETTTLAGAEFVLRNAAGEYYNVNETTKAVTWVEGPAETLDKDLTKENLTGVTVFTTDANGFASFTGIEAGKYQLVEIKAPAGYNKLTAPVNVTISATFNEDGTLKETNTTSTGNGQYKLTSKVANNSGTELPSTGGMGTTLFYIIGGALVIGSLVTMVTKKRVNSEEA